MSTHNETSINKNDKNNVIFRFKFSPEIVDLITRFAKLHQYDDRNTYKESWNLWYSDNEESIQREIFRLHENGYDGDIKDKMYKAGRYYFRKKNTSSNNEPQKRRNYISMDTIVLEAMDQHIKNNINNDDFKPATGYDDFCLNNKTLLYDEIKRLNEEGIQFTDEDLIFKIKKTYKNRYFNLTH